MKRVVCWGFAFALLSLVACTAPTPQLAVEAAWARPTIASGELSDETPNTPGVIYLTIRNRGRQADRLLSVSSPLAANVELHETVRLDGVARMRRIEGGIEVPARGRSELRPGGRHIMLFGLIRPLRRGRPFEATLQFERSAPMTVEVAVR